MPHHACADRRSPQSFLPRCPGHPRQNHPASQPRDSRFDAPISTRVGPGHPARWMHGLLLLLGAGLMLLSGPVVANTGKVRPKAVKLETRSDPAEAVSTEAKTPRHVQRLIFDDDEINALPEQGMGEVVTGERPKAFRSMIHVREDFLPEMIKSAEEL